MLCNVVFVVLLVCLRLLLLACSFNKLCLLWLIILFVCVCSRFFKIMFWLFNDVFVAFLVFCSVCLCACRLAVCILKMVSLCFLSLCLSCFCVCCVLLFYVCCLCKRVCCLMLCLL